MFALPLTPSVPISLKIAADARLATTDYADDAIYALNAVNGPLGLISAYGGRCHGMIWDILWRRYEPMDVAYAVDEYIAPPQLCDFGPGFILLDTQPFGGLQARIAYIAYNSHMTIGRIELEYTASASEITPPIQLELTTGVRLKLNEAVAATFGSAQPLCLEGACHGAYVTTRDLRVALIWDVDGPFETDVLPNGWGWSIYRHWKISLTVGEKRTLVMGLLSGKPAFASHSDDVCAYHTWTADCLRINWAAELERHVLACANIPRIETGNADWDSAIACAYRTAVRCYLSPTVPLKSEKSKSTKGLPYPSFVFTRIPERGYPSDGDPQHHSWQWSGQVATEAYVNIPHVAAFAPELAQAVLRNYLYVQHADGFIDWKPGLAGQRAGWNCMPLLAAMARLIYDYSGDLAFLREVYNGILRHLDHWFTLTNDRDKDGFPEWNNPFQCAFDEHPCFTPWSLWSQGVTISKIESPDLGAYLYREHMDLLAIARLLESETMIDVVGSDPRQDSNIETQLASLHVDIRRLTIRANQLRTQVETLWDEAQAIYRCRDRDSHVSHPGAVVCALHNTNHWALEDTTQVQHIDTNPSSLSTQSALPRRVVVRIVGPEAPDVAVTVYGRSEAGEALEECFTRKTFEYWNAEVSSATSEKLFTVVQRVTVAGLHDRHTVQVRFVDYMHQDQTQLLPLWAGIPDPARARLLVRRTIMDPLRFWRCHGIPNCSAQEPAYASDNKGGSGGVWMMWNTMIGEGLCDYGYFAEAWELFSRIMTAQITSLQQEQCFREAYDADMGIGLGDYDYLWGIVPLHFLTRLHGVQILSHASDSPKSVTVCFLPSDTLERRIIVRQHGVTVIREGRRAIITWPDGRLEEAEVDGVVVLKG